MLTDQQKRWRSPLAVATFAGLVFALISGSALLFFPLTREVHEYWSTVHWVGATIGIVPFAIYQYRHYMRVRSYASQVHYHVGLLSFFAICGSIVTGTLLIPQWGVAVLRLPPVDIAHIFTSFVFTLLISAHLTLVASLTMMRARMSSDSASYSPIAFYFSVGTLLAVAATVLVLAFA